MPECFSLGDAKVRCKWTAYYLRTSGLLGAILHRWLCSLSVAASTVILDQLTKAIVCALLPLGAEKALIDGLLYLKHVRNYGIAFGLADGVGGWLLIVSAICLLAMLVWGGRIIGESAAACLAFGLMLGGGIGNTLDRLFRGSVVDFIDLRFWPVFNIADMALTAGVACMLITMYIRWRGCKGNTA